MNNSIIGMPFTAIAIAVLCALQASLKADEKLEFVTPEMPNRIISKVEFTENDRCLLTGYDEPFAVLRDTKTGKILRLFDPSDGVPVSRDTQGRYGVHAISADGSRIAAALGKMIFVWETQTGRQLLSIKNPSEIKRIALSRDGSRIVTFADQSAVIWDGASGRRIKSIRGHDYVWVNAVVSGDGTRALIEERPSKLVIWNIEKSSPIHTIPDAFSFGISTDGTRVLVGSLFVKGLSEAKCVLWDMATGESLGEFKGLEDTVMYCSISADGKVVAAGSDHRAIVWDTMTRQALQTIEVESGSLNCLKLNSTGSQIAIGYSNREGEVRDTKTGDVVLLLEGASSRRVEFLGDTGRRACIKSADRTCFWDPSTGDIFASIDHDGLISTYLLCDDQNSLFAGVDRQRELIQFKPFKRSKPLEGLSEPPIAVCMSGNGRVIAWMDMNKSITVRDVQTDRDLVTWECPPESTIGYVFLSQDGSRLAMGPYVWSVPDGKLIQTIQLPKNSFSRTALSPDGKYLMTATLSFLNPGNLAFAIWNVETGRKMKSLQTRPEAHDFSFSSDSKRILTTGDFTSRDPSVALSDVETGKRLRLFAGHLGFVHFVVEMNDGKMIAASGSARTIVWDAKTGDELCRFTCPKGDINDWFCVTPQGYFDGTQNTREQVRFRISGTLEAIANEEAARRLYRPKLFARLLAGERADELADH